jgi:hypothetical protein
MTDLTNDLPERVDTTQENDAVPVLITFALLFLLSAAVWFVLDRIRADEVRTELSQRATHSQNPSGTRVQPSKVAAAE